MIFLIDLVAYCLVLVLAAIFNRLPENIALGIGRNVGKLFFYFSSRRRVAYADLKAAFGERYSAAGRWAIIRDHYARLGQMAVEFVRFPKLDRAAIERLIQFHHPERFFDLPDHDRGTVLLTAHLGNWELMQIASGIRGKPVHVLARNQKYNRLNQLLNRFRETHGSVAITRGMGIRDLIRALKRREVIGMLGD
ncbi:MAG: hypothetical protein NC930_07700, partial [Candidatus Omnitrophica bacterium]|nr:hypothetical protein [Candidatus Omnitrophota bacterium]